ncbi:MAG: hypothetical protein KJ638_03595 [Chloroflexi bacterium]|nr:hypothetical protein [Chloroflexota bacterium]
MQKFFTTLARLITFLCALLFIVGMLLAILAFDVGRVVFNPPLVKSVLTEIVTESDLIPAALAWFSESRAARRYDSGQAEAWVGEPDVAQLIMFMDVNDWRPIRWEVLPDEILIDWVSVTVDGEYDWIDSDDRVPDIMWNLRPLIRLIDSEHGVTSITIAYEALPPCAEKQITDFKNRLAAAPAGTKVLYNLCQFPDPWYEDQFSDYTASLEDLVANVPTTFALTGELARTTDTEGLGPEIIKTQVLLVRKWMNLAPLILIIPLILILIFAVRSLNELGRWWGIPLTLGSLLTLLLAFVYRPIVVAILSAGLLSETPPLVREEAIAGIFRLAVDVFKPMLWQSLVVLIIGLALVLAGSLVKTDNDESETDSLKIVA